MKIRLLFTIIALLSIGILNISKAQSIYKRKLENVQDSNTSSNKSSYSGYSSYKFDKKTLLRLT